MHRYLRLLLGSGLLAASSLAWAAEQPAAEDADTQDKAESPQGAQSSQSSETDATDAAEPPANGTVAVPKVPVVPGAKDALPGKVHTVVHGDTLWDLSQSYLGTPWYWPKVWSYNPQIANPHWIYPGNQVRFFPGAGEEGPSRVEVADESGAEDEDASKPVTPADQVDPDTFKTDESTHDKVEVVGKIGYTPKQLGGLVRREGFISSRETDSVGTLTESPNPELFLAPPQRVYLTFKKPQDAKVGDRYLIFRAVRDVFSRSGRWVGYFTRVRGTVRVVSVENKRVVAKLEKAWEEIERGDKVGPYGEPYLERLKERPNDRNLSGYILGTTEPMMLLGQNQYLLVDLGSADGVQVGNTFSVVRQNDPSSLAASIDPSTEVDRQLPQENIATCMAVDVREKAALCLVTHALIDIVEGDRVIMVPPSTSISANR